MITDSYLKESFEAKKLSQHRFYSESWKTEGYEPAQVEAIDELYAEILAECGREEKEVQDFHIYRSGKSLILKCLISAECAEGDYDPEVDEIVMSRQARYTATIDSLGNVDLTVVRPFWNC